MIDRLSNQYKQHSSFPRRMYNIKLKRVFLEYAAFQQSELFLKKIMSTDLDKNRPFIQLADEDV